MFHGLRLAQSWAETPPPPTPDPRLPPRSPIPWPWTPRAPTLRPHPNPRTPQPWDLHPNPRPPPNPETHPRAPTPPRPGRSVFTLMKRTLLFCVVLSGNFSSLLLSIFLVQRCYWFLFSRRKRGRIVCLSSTGETKETWNFLPVRETDNVTNKIQTTLWGWQNWGLLTIRKWRRSTRVFQNELLYKGYSLINLFCFDRHADNPGLCWSKLVCCR